jgi:hypothetical protein
LPGAAKRDGRDFHPQPAPSPERIAAASFLILPVAGFAVALLTKSLIYRYVLETVVGAGCLVALLVHDCARRRPFLGMVAVVSLLCYAPLAVGSRYRSSEYLFSPQLRDLTARLLRQQPDPLVFDKFHYPPAVYYTDPTSRGRVFTLHSSQYHMSDTELEFLSRIAPVQIVPVQSFIREHRRFLVVADEEGLVEEIQKSGFEIQLYAYNAGAPVFLAVAR